VRRGLGGATSRPGPSLFSSMRSRQQLSCPVLRPPRPLLAVPNVTAHTSTASVPITAVLLCPLKG